MTEEGIDIRLVLVRRMIAEAREEARAVGSGFVPCSDDNISPAGLVVTYGGVTREDPVLVCTEQDGHEGDHVAGGVGDDEIARWARGTGRAG